MYPQVVRRCLVPRSIPASSNRLAAARQFQTSNRSLASHKNDTDFDPSATSPESQRDKAEEQTKGLTRDATFPMDESANKTNNAQEGGKTGSPSETGGGSQSRQGQSGGASPKKGGTPTGGGGSS